MKYRALSEKEIRELEKSGCQADSWKHILVRDGFVPARVMQTRFSGEVKLGLFNDKVKLHGQIEQPTGIYHSYIINSDVGDNTLISDVRYLANYDIGDHVVIDHANSITMSGESTFGNGTEIEILNEAGGRELILYDQLSAQVAYLLVTYRHDRPFIDALSGLIRQYVASRKSARGRIDAGTQIFNCGDLKNLWIGQDSRLEGCIRLESGTLASSQHDPVFIGTGVIAKNFVVQSGSTVDSGALLVNCFIGQGVQIGKQLSVENSAFFANCEGFHGEACSVFAGPYSVTHHKSTLLIAGMFSFYNAGSGTNQSNHMYKLGPVHQGILERGSKTGSFSYLLWPSRAGAYSAIVGKHYANFDTRDLPFSYIVEDHGNSTLIPAINLFTVGTRRDSIKWPNRDRRKDPVKYDLIHFDLFSPYIIAKMLRGIQILQDLYSNSSPKDAYVSFNEVRIKREKLLPAVNNYQLIIDIFIGDEILKKLNPFPDLSDFRSAAKILGAPYETSDPEWVDLAGLFASKSSIKEFMSAVSGKKIENISEIQLFLNDIYMGYEEACWAWCADLIKMRLKKPVSKLTAKDLSLIITNWRDNSVTLNDLILKDAEKEFNKRSQTGFGIDGDDATAELDFADVRGTFDDNKFVKETVKEKENIKNTAKKWLEVFAK
jgi:hypothetical protein